MSTEAQRVVVIQDASKDVSCGAIRGVLQSSSLKMGDELTLLAVLHQVNNPSTLAGKLLGYKIKVDSNSMFGANQKIIEEELLKKEMEYHDNEDIVEVSQQCEREQIQFHIEVIPGSSPKLDALEHARRLKATWVILDREMKKHNKYFMDKLSCGISKVKRDNSIEILREPIAIESSKIPRERSSKHHIKYDEMIPGSPEKKHSPKKDTRNFELEEYTATMKRVMGRENQDRGSKEVYNAGNPDEQIQHSTWMGGSQPDEFENSICSKCQNRRPRIGWIKDFTYAELQAATDNFSDNNFLSEGGFGSVYSGELNGLKIAVKQHKNASFQGEKEFKAEVHVLSKARHKNLVMLLGSCSERSHRLLVYEYVCNRSLDQHLSEHTRKPLRWEMRMKIAFGAAKGLQYLHQNNIIHRDMRPNNILVTHDYESMLGDFGLARTHEDTDHSSETGVVGTLGYLAPEYAESGRVSAKTDVYAYGIILLQLITGLRPSDKFLEEKSLVGWARPKLKEKNYPDLIDPRIIDSHDVHQLFWMVRVAEKCLSKDPHKRVSMDKVVSALQYLMEANTTCHIDDFSPANSDSACSVPGSSETQGEEANTESIETTLKRSSSIGETSGGLSLSPSTQCTSSGRSSTDTVSRQSSLDSIKDDDFDKKDVTD
ncbi:hypothetical protein FNV43_RR09480 [Rhamnella rubrinervis]|uniref:Protein kinase domain-containing protein n=1 Tax=Rhamnella rubrinervis TaxID=2594499 RepID=A0A8K0HA63_9ROSA|nr:hypothetical protein FNV43_RR09480 [Rhamnella rubrinervis]